METSLYRAQLAPLQGGGGWKVGIVDGKGHTLLDVPLGSPVSMHDALRVLWSSLRRVHVGLSLAEHERFGNVVVGMSPDGYVKPVRHEPGGAAIVPYTIDPATGEVFIGMLKVKRGLVGGGEPIDEIPRGFREPHERELVTAGRELLEETGVKGMFVQRIEQLPGSVANADSAFHVTDPATQLGISMYALPIAWSELNMGGVGPHRAGHLVPGLEEGIREVNEKIDPAGLTFVPLEQALKTGDNISRGAMGALVGMLLARGSIAWSVVGKAETTGLGV